MATIKGFTDLSQSKTLSKILPLESADMEYLSIKESGLLVGNVPFVKDDSEVENSAYSHTYDRIACWSLAVLLGVIPNPSLHKTFSGWRCDSYNEEETSCILGEPSDNPVDACVATIEKLHKLKKCCDYANKHNR